MTEFRCIAVETATEWASVAACNGDRSAIRHLENTATSSRQIFGVIRDLLQETGLDSEPLDCVAFGCGPGGFTGVRVAASVAQGLAYARQVPVVPVSTLQALAFNAAAEPDGLPVCACLDARMGEAYTGFYHFKTGASIQLLPDALVNPADWRMPETEGGFVAAGPGWAAFPEMLGTTTSHVRFSADSKPDAEAVLKLAQERYLAGEMVEASRALPNYLRNKVTQ